MNWENQLRTIASFYFEPLVTYRYEAGQYAVISLPHQSFDSRGYSRTMTLSSSPTDKLLRFTMRLLPVGGSSFKQALSRLRPGDEITVFESMGDLVLPLDTSIPLVFIAGGVGIASFTGMTLWLLDNHEQRDVSLYYAVSRPGDIALQQPFDDYIVWQTTSGHKPLTRSLYTPSVNSSYAYADDTKFKRLESSDVLVDINLQQRACSQFYVSGTQQFVEDITQDLEKSGISRQQIIFDYFNGYSRL